MKITGSLIILFAACVLSAADIVRDGKSLATILIPRESPRTVVFAAGELREHLEKMTGAGIPLSWSDPDRRNPAFILEIRPEKEWKGRESAQAFRITETEKPAPQVRITGNTGLAVVYGVYRYLHSLGVRWFEPGAEGSEIPRKRTIAVKKGVRSESPAVLSRCMDFSNIWQVIYPVADHRKDPDGWKNFQKTVHYEYDLWLLRNLMHFERTIHDEHLFDFNRKPGIKGHSLYPHCGLSPALFAKEPERFAMVTRNYVKQRIWKDAQPCFTNEKNIRTAIRTAVDYYRKMEKSKNRRNTDLDEIMDVSMALADGPGICECPECRKVGGDGPYWRDRLVWHFMNRVAKGLREEIPHGKISLFAPYLELKRPPEGVRIEPNIIAIACRTQAWHNTPDAGKTAPFSREYLENVRATQKAGAQIATYDYIYWGATPQTMDVLDAVKSYQRDWKVSRQYHLEVMERGPHVYPFLWAIAQSVWDGKQDPRERFAYYLENFYGKGNGRLLLNLFLAIQKNSQKLNRITFGCLNALSVMLPDEMNKQWCSALAAAERNVTGIHAARMRRFRTAFEFQIKLGEAYRAYLDALVSRTPETVGRFRRKAEEARRFWDAEKLEYTFYSNSAVSGIRMLKRLETAKFDPVVPVPRKLTDKEKYQEVFSGLDTMPPRSAGFRFLPDVWKFMIDPRDSGLESGWHKPAFDDSKWFPLSSSNFIEEQGFPEFEGRFWYRVKFTVPREFEGKKITLRIGSLDDDGDIYINGKLAFSRTDASGWDKSFAFDATGFLFPGKENVIAIRGYDNIGAGGLWRPSAIYTGENRQ